MIVQAANHYNHIEPFLSLYVQLLPVSTTVSKETSDSYVYQAGSRAWHKQEKCILINT